MFFTFKWMDNLQWIEHHQKIKNCLLFFIFNFTCCKFFAFKENHYSISRPTTLRVFLMGRSGYPTKQGNWGGGGSPCKSKSLNFPLLLDKNITYWEIPHIGEKGISFLTIFNKKFASSMHSVTQIWLLWKSSIKTKSLNTKQGTAGLSPRIICKVSPFLTKMSKNCSTHQVWTARLFPNFLWEDLGMGENPTQHPKMYSSFPSEKSPLIDLNLLLLNVSFLSHQIAMFK